MQYKEFLEKWLRYRVYLGGETETWEEGGESVDFSLETNKKGFLGKKIKPYLEAAKKLAPQNFQKWNNYNICFTIGGFIAIFFINTHF